MKEPTSSARDAWERRDSPIGGVAPRDFRRNPQRRLRSVIEGWIAASGDSSLLDVACNAGIEGWRLREAGWRGLYAGIDRNPKGLAAARDVLAGRGPALLVRADARRLPFRDRSFDAVLVKDLLEHLPGYEAALAEAARVARRRLVLAFFIRPGRTERIRRHPDGYHLNRYARAPLLARLASLGFAVERSRTVWRPWTRDEVLLASRDSRDPAP